jgi:signal transduction histidine kinase
MRFSWRVVLIVIVAAALATAFSTALSVQLEQSRGVAQPVVWRLVMLNGAFWFGWVLLSAPLVLLAHRLRVDRRPRVAVPVHIGALLHAVVLQTAIGTTAQTIASRDRLRAEKPDAAAEYRWAATWRRIYPMQFTQLVDWQLIAGAAIVGIAHAGFYYRESQQRALETAQLETRLIDAQLQALQSQLHPHFLFNTLHAISALMHRDVQAADRMLVQLSDLLRMTLDTVNHPEIRLTEEMDFLAKYLRIEQVRLGDRLTVALDVDADVLDAVVPALILQPLAENAIKHGIAPHVSPGRVTVAARRDGDMLTMTVSDTGPGPGERAMAAFSSGIGVSNTRARLTHQFGARFRFEFQRHREGFTVLVAIPFRQDTLPAASGSPLVHTGGEPRVSGSGHPRSARA